MWKRLRGAPFAVIAAGVAAVLLAVVTGLQAAGGSHSTQPVAAGVPVQSPSQANSGTSGADPVAADPVAADIAKQQATLRRVPGDYDAWAVLGLDYVQQAKIKVDPAYYPKAEGSLARSLALNSTTNVAGFAGQAALKAAQHDFAAARSWAQRGLRVDPANAVLVATLNDADTQLGRYAEAFAAADRLNQLHPGVPAFTRAEYVYELRGDIPRAEAAMRLALDAAESPADTAFAQYYLGELAFGRGDAAASLQANEAGLAADPTYLPLLQGKARAEAALGRVADAVRDYAQVVRDVPQPQYVIEAGEYLQSVGQIKAAQQMYRLFEVEARLFTANGVTLDTDPTLFYADHGDPAKAVAAGVVGIRIRPFIEMDDAYAWALHRAGRDREALGFERKAMALGTRNALFFFHAAMIELALGDRLAARSDLERAFAINPHFSPLHEPQARRTLSMLAAAR
jgi:tetratricopeptide (TPR) repeat protein